MSRKKDIRYTPDKGSGHSSLVMPDDSGYTPTPQMLLRAFCRREFPEMRYFAWRAGKRGGKTYASCKEAVRYAYSHPESPVCYIEPTHQMCRDIALPYLLKMTDWCRLPGSKGYNKTDKIFTFNNGATLLLRSGSDPDKLEGLTLGAFFMDECAIQPEGVYRILMERILSTNGIGYFGTTPKGLDWFYDAFFESQKPNVLTCMSRTVDNRNLPPEAIQELREHFSARFAQQELEAEFVSMEGLVFSEFDPEKNVIEMPFREDRPIEIGLDFGYRKPAILFFQEDDKGNDVLVKDWLPKNCTIERIRDHLMPLQNQIRSIHCDPAGDSHNTATHLTDYAYLKQAGFNIKYNSVPRFRSINTSAEILRSRICNSMEKRRWFMAKNDSGIVPKGTFQAMLRYQYKKNSSEPNKDGKEDPLDAARYHAVCKYCREYGKLDSQAA